MNEKGRKVPTNDFDHIGAIIKIRNNISSHYYILGVHIRVEKVRNIRRKRQQDTMSLQKLILKVNETTRIVHFDKVEIEIVEKWITR